MSINLLQYSALQVQYSAVYIIYKHNLFINDEERIYINRIVTKNVLIYTAFEILNRQ